MPKSKKDSKSGSQDSKKKPDKKDKKVQRESLVDEPPVQEEIPLDTGERFITFTIKSLTDLKRYMYQGSGVRFGVEFGDAFRAQSPVFPVGEKETQVDWSVSISCYPNTFTGRDFIATHPIHVTLMEAEIPLQASEGDNQNAEPPTESKIFGRSNLDLASFLTANTEIYDVVYVRQNKYAIAEELITWPLLPQITLTATLEATLDVDPTIVDNIFTVTLESMYNLAPNLTADLQYQARTCVPSLDAPTTLFDAGVWADIPSRDRTKRWVGLAHVVDAGAFTNTNLGGKLKTPPGIHVNEAKLQQRHVPHVEWNLTKRFYIPDKETLFTYIHKYRCWPLEIMATSPPPSADGDAGVEPVKLHMVVFLDVADLARPGETRTRVVGQVFTFSEGELEARSSLKRSMFEMVRRVSPVAADVEKVAAEEIPLDAAPSKKGKTPAKGKAGKSKTGTSADVTTVPTPPTPVAVEVVVESPPPSREYKPPEPLFAQKGRPTFVIVDLELLRTLTEKRIRGACHVAAIIPKRPYLAPHIMSIRLADEHFGRCIEKATELIAQDYEAYKNDPTDPVFPNRQEPVTFSGYLVTTGTYQKVRESLKNKVASLIREKLGRGERVTKHAIGPFLEEMHVQFTEKMRNVVKRFLFGEGGMLDFQLLESEKFVYYAQEANEENAAHAARNMYLRRITNDMRNPNLWIDKAIFRALDNIYVGIECLREALFLDTRHQITVLMYGILLALSNSLGMAEVCMKYVVRLYPEFTRGWMVLYTFYSITLHCPEAAERCLVAGKRSWKEDKVMSEAHWLCIERTPIVWNPDFDANPDVYMDTAIFLLKLNLTLYAEFMFSQSMIHFGRSPSIKYYAAVNMYLQGKYGKAMLMLANFPDDIADVVALKGHCSYKHEDYHMAGACFEKAIEIGCQRPFVFMRLGKCYVWMEKISKAKETFTTAWRLKITPETCLGVGMCLYRQKEYLEAERTLTTGSSLSHSNAQIWGYLALVHEKMKRQDQFEDAIKQAVRHNLQEGQLFGTMDNFYLSQLKINFSDSENISVYDLSGHATSSLASRCRR